MSRCPACGMKECCGAEYSEEVEVLEKRIAELEAEKDEIRQLFGIGEKAFTHSVLMENIRNTIRRNACLGRIEGYITRTVTDEDGEEWEECPLNWGSEPEDYLTQFIRYLGEGE